MFDFVLCNAKLIDGTGNPWYYADVAIKGEKIAAILPCTHGADTYSVPTIDLEKQVLCPGFIDGHSHSELSLLENPLADSKVMQGVTTENLGLDGMSLAPIKDDDKKDWQKHLSGLTGKNTIEWNWNSLAEYFDRVDEKQPSINVSSYIGLGTVRLMAMGMTDRAATEEELELMRQIVAKSMQEGARGISAGLIYPPGQYQNTAEIIELSKVAASYGGIFDVHMRNEADFIADSIDEVITIGKESGISVMITHFKVRGRKNWGRSAELIQKIDAARADGIDVHMAQYPYTAGSTFLHVIIPPWYHRLGIEKLLIALKEDREQIKKDIYSRTDWENFTESVGLDRIYVSSVTKPENEECVGKSITEIASMREVEDPIDAALDLLYDEELAVGMISFGLDEVDIEAIMKHPAVSFITDNLMSGRPHPRAYATYPRILGRYVREKKIISLEEAIRKMTSLPARKIRLKNKGLVNVGFDADLVVFDENTIYDSNSYDDPRVYPQGIKHVFVNGKQVVKDGRHTGIRAGRTIRDFA